MDIVLVLQKIMMIGAEWILLLLLGLSVAALVIVFERVMFFRAVKPIVPELTDKVVDAFERKELAALGLQCKECPSPEGKMLAVFLKYETCCGDALEKHLSAALIKIQYELDKNLPFLNTLGNNAPFIGLLGTVFGVITAFHHLAETGVGNSSIVMTGISEALVATGVGLCVAIPAVVFYNTFVRRVKRRMASLQRLKETLLALRSMQNHPTSTSTNNV